MGDVDYARAQDGLPAVALALMQNLDPAEQAALGVQLEQIRQDKDISDHTKSLTLGLALATAVGPEVLEETKAALGAEILREKAPSEEAEEANDVRSGVHDRSSGRGLPATPQTPNDPEDGP